MNYRMLGMYKKPMNLIEKLSVGWRHILDIRWEWWYHLTEAPSEMNFEFWMMLNQDIVEYHREHYYEINE